MLTFIKKLEKLPVAVAGLALGMASIGNVIANELPVGYSFYIFPAIATLLLLLIVTKKLSRPKLLWHEISHPVLGSFIPAFDMCLMVIAELIAKHNLIIGQTLWYSAIILHVVFTSCFFYYRLRNFDLNHMLPSWYVPPVGIVVACVTGGQMHAENLVYVIFYVGLTLYAIMLPIMLYRLIFGDRIQDAQLPSFAIMGAPASLCLAGYLTAFKNPHAEIVGILLALALMMTSLVYISMFRINHLKIHFVPIYASFTFPLAVGSVALFKYSRYIGINSEAGQFWHMLGKIEMFLAIIVIVWVLFKMVHYVNEEFKTVEA